MTVGTDTPRIDARPKATGETKFVGDLIVPGMVYGKLIRSLRQITNDTLDKEPSWRHKGDLLTTGYHSTW